MALESITWVSDLVITNPAAVDFLNEGDDHIKGVKVALKNSFPNINGAVNATPAELNKLVGVGVASVVFSTSAGQWKLMADAAVTGTPTAIDLVHNVGNVEFSSSFDLFMLECIDMSGGVTALNMQMSINLGVTFPASATSSSHQNATINAGTAANSAASLQPSFIILPQAFFGVNSHAITTFTRNVSQSPNRSYVRSEWSASTGGASGSQEGMVSNGGAFNAIRLLPGSGSFATTGRYRLWGRRG